jgi:uncharacterized protein YdiU (UPF0061 family)
MATLETLNFNNSYALLPESFHRKLLPTPLQSPYLISFNPDVANLLDLDACTVKPKQLALYMGGQAQLPGSEPLAMKYTGHQFGVYNPDLGDGRGLLLGEVVNERGERWDLHLKGAGKTPFSRFGDGRAVLRSSVREYLISEAMQGLGIPTTRALALTGSEDTAMREGLQEPCATLLRVSQCHIRFGHFEYFYHSGQHQDLKRLADYAITRYFPHFLADKAPYLRMFTEVVQRSASLVAQWQAYGFVHAVLNTDNMSLIGETFDYGPYSFMDQYKPGLISNQNDFQGRYAFAQQPAIVHWNLSALAQALLPLINREALIAALDRYPQLYKEAEIAEFKKRLGLQAVDETDEALITSLLALFSHQALDINRFFRTLCDYDGSEHSISELSALVCNERELKEWLALYDQRLLQESSDFTERSAFMQAVNPRFILRNYMAEEAIKSAEQGDFTRIHDLLAILRDPFAEHSDFARYAESPPEWAGAICLTCSS